MVHVELESTPDPLIKVELANVTSFFKLIPRVMHNVMQAVKCLYLDMLRGRLLYSSSLILVLDSVRNPGGSRLSERRNRVAPVVLCTCVLYA